MKGSYHFDLQSYVIITLWETLNFMAGSLYFILLAFGNH